MATSIPVTPGNAISKTVTQSDTAKPDAEVQISTMEIKTQPNNLKKPSNTASGLVAAKGLTPSLGNKAVRTAPKKSNIPPGFKLVEKPLGNGTVSFVLRKMSPEELIAAGQTADASPGFKPATIPSPVTTSSTPSRSVAASVSATSDKPDATDKKSISTLPSTSCSSNVATGSTTIMGGLVMAAESFAKMTEHGMKIHSTLTGTPLPSTSSATAGTPAPTATPKPVGEAPRTAPQIHSRLVVPTNASSSTLAIAPAAATGLASIPTSLQAPLTQEAVPSLAGQPASILSYYTNSIVANTTQTAAQSNVAHTSGSASDDINPDGDTMDHAQNPGDHSGQQQHDSFSHDHRDDLTSPQAPDEDHQDESKGQDTNQDHQDGDIPYEPQEGDIPYEPEEGDIPYEPEEGDIPYEPEEGDIPYELDEGDIPYDPQEGDITYGPEEGDIPYDDQDEAPLEQEEAVVANDFEPHDQGWDGYSGGQDDDEGYDVDDEPEDDFDYEQADDDAY